MQILPMTATDYPHFQAETVRMFVAEKVRSQGLGEAEALDLSQKTVATFLPDGLATRQNYFYSIYTEKGPQGWIWVAVRGSSTETRELYVYDLYLDPAIRGRGHGRTAMRFIEARARELGLQRVGLHVFGHNEIARKLYEAEGFKPTSIVMEKRLS